MIKRAVAGLFDITIFTIIVLFVNPYIVQFIYFLSGEIFLFAPLYVLIISVLIYFLLFEVIFFTSPGKWLFNLAIFSTNHTQPERSFLLLRGFLKLITLMSMLGALINLILILATKHSWYDKTLNLYVESTV